MLVQSSCEFGVSKSCDRGESFIPGEMQFASGVYSHTRFGKKLVHFTLTRVRSSQPLSLFDLLKSLGPVGLLENLQLKRAQRLVKDASRLRVKPFRSRKLATRTEFRQFLRWGCRVLEVFMFL